MTKPRCVSRATIRLAVIVADADLRIESISATLPIPFYISYFEHPANTFQKGGGDKGNGPEKLSILDRGQLPGSALWPN